LVPQPGHSSTTCAQELDISISSRERILTIAVIEFPDGPVTLIQAPQLAAVAQFESERAVPKREDGSV